MSDKELADRQKEIISRLGQVGISVKTDKTSIARDMSSYIVQHDRRMLFVNTKK